MTRKTTDPNTLLNRHFAHSARALAIVLKHSRLVAAKAVAIATAAMRQGVAVDLEFLEEGAMLHDIGVCRVNSPHMDCHGFLPYIAHGLAGREILESEGLPRHALLCERHIGVGLTKEDILLQKLPLPCRDMVPLSVEERIVCMADLFFSKTPDWGDRERTIAEVEMSLSRFGDHKVNIFRICLAEFGCHPSRL
jgi:uncharacterized protein